MITNRKLKIWTIITHGLILVAFGHAAANFLVIEIFTFPYFTAEEFSLNLDASFRSHLPVVGLTSLLGQIAMIISLLNKRPQIKLAFQVAGLILFWTSIIYFTHNNDEGNYFGFPIIGCIPFIVCTLLALIGKPLNRFIGQPLKRFYNWYLDK